ncbi:hypothetical protein [Enterococcus sp.]|uniref:hypothetical protein n=1 Tax=Enterococcus sp. TaxID=35783 RepID=UPI002FCB9674
MASTHKKAQQLQKKGTGILSSFQLMEETLTSHVEETKKLQAEIKAEVESKYELLEQLESTKQESATVLQNLRDFLGHK